MSLRRLVSGTGLWISVIGIAVLSAVAALVASPDIRVRSLDTPLRRDISRPADDLSAPFRRGNDGTVVIDLETEEVVAEIEPGVTYEYWTFNGTVPGPFLKVKEGETVEIRLTHTSRSRNAAVKDHMKDDRSDADPHTVGHAAGGHGAHSIDLHAVSGPGGGATLTQVESGETKVFRFRASRPGVYVYHCASPHVPTHIANGMYGLIVVEPAVPLSPVDHEFYVMQGELYTSGAIGNTGHQRLSFAKLMAERPEYVIFNGRVGAIAGSGALQASAGDRIRLYVGNGGFLPSSFHVIGAVFDRVYSEGDLLSPPRRNVQTTLIPAGGAAVVEFTVEQSGDYYLVDHSLTRSIDRGALGMIRVSAEEDSEERD